MKPTPQKAAVYKHKKRAVGLKKFIFGKLARATVKKYRPEIIAITGSAGKTSAKEAISALFPDRRLPLALGAKMVRKTLGNYNDELGMPLSVMGLWEEKDLKLLIHDDPSALEAFQKLFVGLRIIFVSFWRLIFKTANYPRLLILEYGADGPGDIKHLVQIAKPMAGVITAIGEIPAHVTNYADTEELAGEKARLIEALPQTGYAILNNDDDAVINLRGRTKAKVWTFGFSGSSDVRIGNFENKPVSNGNGAISGAISFTVEYRSEVAPIVIKNVFGKAHAYSAAAAVCAGLARGMNLLECAELIGKNYKPGIKRMNLAKGINNSWIIDDSYNSSPIAMTEALTALGDLKARRKIAVLAEMLELGNFSEQVHRAMGKLAAQSSDILITAGLDGMTMAETAKQNGMKEENVFSFAGYKEVLEQLPGLIMPEDLILIKASRRTGLAQIAERIRL